MEAAKARPLGRLDGVRISPAFAPDLRKQTTHGSIVFRDLATPLDSGIVLHPKDSAPQGA